MENTIDSKINSVTLDKFKGCLLAGAYGDALGAPVEWLNEEEIVEKYGEVGITKITDQKSGKITDDTQMTMYTADGLILANKNNLSELESIRKCYIDWFNTQKKDEDDDELVKGYSSLLKYRNLQERRGPGSTCLNAIAFGADGTLENPVNYSKGCGGIMRTAPIGLYYKNKNLIDTAILAAQASALTHGHELGYIPSAIFSMVIAKLVHSENIVNLEKIIRDVLKIAEEIFSEKRFINDCIKLVELALDLAKKDLDDIEAIHKLGEGWVAEETLAIAVYCTLKYKNDFKKAISVSVNHNGDSDSTGAVTGNLIGAYLGLDGIEKQCFGEDIFKDIEFNDVISELAEKLYLLKK